MANIYRMSVIVSFLKHGTGSGSPIRMFYCKYKHGCLFDKFHIHGMIYAMISSVSQALSLRNRPQNAILCLPILSGTVETLSRDSAVARKPGFPGEETPRLFQQIWRLEFKNLH